MRVDARILLDKCGIDCTKADYSEAAESLDFRPARIAFVTPETFEIAKLPQRDQSGQKVKYGDALITWTDNRGKPRAVKAEIGKDAAVYLRIQVDGETQLIPFTGSGMLKARGSLLSMPQEDLEANYQRALEGIRSVTNIIISHPDHKRFSATILGHAFASVMLDNLGQPAIPVSIEEFGRKARADLIRAKITRISPDSPDSFRPLRSMDSILDDFGIGSLLGEQIRMAGRPVDEEMLRRLISSNDEVRDDVFGKITTTKSDRISAASMGADDFDILKEGLSSHQITGSWIDRIGSRLTEITQERVEGYRAEIFAFSIDNRDLIAVRDNVYAEPGAAYAYSWPTMDRLPAAERNGSVFVNLSPEEIPSHEEVEKLQANLDLMRFQEGADLEYEIDGILIPPKSDLRRS